MCQRDRPWEATPQLVDTFEHHLRPFFLYYKLYRTFIQMLRKNARSFPITTRDGVVYLLFWTEQKGNRKVQQMLFL